MVEETCVKGKKENKRQKKEQIRTEQGVSCLEGKEEERSLSLTRRCSSIIRKHREEAGFEEKRRVPQWEEVVSVYDPKTGRLHLHKDTPLKPGLQQFKFEASFGVASTMTTHAVKFWDLERKASPRELARMHGFPDSFLVPKTRASDLFGNDVTVPVARHAIGCLLSSMRSDPFGGSPPVATFVDVCSGVGGFHVAASQVGLSCVGYSEVKQHAKEAYDANFPGTKDLGDLTTADWPSCDLVLAGFPCQPFSRCLKADRSSHPEKYVSSLLCGVLSSTGASGFVFENVPTLATIGKENFDSLLSDLDKEGFETSFRVFDSHDFGVPQRRRRLFLIGRRVGSDLVGDERKQLLLSPPPCLSSGRTILADVLE